MSGQKSDLESNIAWHEESLASLQRERARLPYLWLLALLAVPAGWLYGVIAALLVVVGAAVVFGLAAYLIEGHRAEYEGKLVALRRELAQKARE